MYETFMIVENSTIMITRCKMRLFQIAFHMVAQLSFFQRDIGALSSLQPKDLFSYILQ